MKLFFILFTLHFFKLIACEDETPPAAEPEQPPAEDGGGGDGGGGGGAGSTYGIPKIPSIDLLEDIEEDIPVLEYDIHLERERNLVSDFKYEKVHTKIDHGWANLPDISAATLKQQMGIESCQPYLELTFKEYRNQSRKLCLFKEADWAEKIGEFEDDGTKLNASDLVEKVSPVRGFVVREVNSLVRGYIKEGHFYGQVRIFDVQMGYHLHFYIEPTSNLPLYGASGEGEGRDTAIMFEYVAHADRDSSIVISNDDEEDNKRPVAEGKPIRKKREAPKLNRKKRNDGATDGDLPTQDNEDDIYEAHHVDGGAASSKIFDSPSLKNFHCPICVWVQPNFADKFGYGSSKVGIAEVINILSSLDWALRSFDFNEDYFAENFGIMIKKILVSDNISVKKATSEEVEKPNKSRRKRSNKKRNRQSYMKNLDPNAAEEDWGDGHKKVKNKKREDPTPSPATVKRFFTDVSTISPKEAYKIVLDQIKGLFSDCCAMIAFVYHNIAPVISVSTVGGLCGTNNLILVSGVLNEHKIGSYDVLRGILHGFAHLLGATHEEPLDFHCNTGKPSSFIDPLLMHQHHQLNVGLRPNSFRLSTCKKREIVQFMMSRFVNMDCFETNKEQFCGNGITEFDEECDCGSPAQCHEQICCGERETVFQCRSFQTARRIPCDAPQRW